MGSWGTSFSVCVKHRDTVAATLPVQNHWLPMSNLDLLLPPLDVGVFFCYKKPLDDCVTLMKESLAQSLALFYPFAGEIVENSQGEPEILCNNRGVDFVHAYADVELKNLDLFRPDDSVEGKLVPLKKRGVLSVQVTELNCGGLVIGCTFDHRIADAYSINMFLVSWAQIAQSKPISCIPSFRRSTLNARRPPLTDTFYDTLFVPLSSLPPQPPTDPLITRIYHIKAKEIDRLQSLSCLNGSPKRSKLTSFIAFLWKIIAHANVCKMGVVVDGRERMNSKSFSTESYFGNVLSIPYGEANAGELTEMPLSRVADLVHGFVSPATNEEHFRGLIDWVELQRPEPAVAKIYVKTGKDDGGDAVVVSSGQRFPVGSVDFGWGRPEFGSYHFPWGGQTGYVMPMPMPNAKNNGDWIVYMHLFQKHLDLVEVKGSKVFKPLTPMYMDL